ncbi:MAG: glycosyltransferase [Nitrospirae bacterium]|nr:glycosyltransferase [Nitrospirota bacterium]
MTMETKRRLPTVLHVATINKPIVAGLGYGPIEAIIRSIDRGVHSLDHRSIVACSADSRVAGEQYATVHRSLGDYWRGDTADRRNLIETHLSRALERAQRGDIAVIQMHEWLDYIFNGAFHPHAPIVMTLHVQAKDSVIKEFYQGGRSGVPIPRVHFVAISEFQKRQYHGLANIYKTIHHGIEVQEYPSKEEPDKGGYLFSIGRITQAKGQDKAIELAKTTGSKLIIAGCVQNRPADKEFFEGLKSSIDLFVDVGKQAVDENYYCKVIKPLLDCDKRIIYIGELDGEQKKLWYRHARATLFPIQWGEPFGLVLIESMACGTPVLAFNEGAVPEILADGKTGFVVDSLGAMIEALDLVDGIDPRECRRHVREHFSVTRMAHEYSELYQQIAVDFECTAAAAGPRAPLWRPAIPGVLTA